MRKRILMADAHRLMLQGLEGLLATEFDVVGMVTNGRPLLLFAGVSGS